MATLITIATPIATSTSTGKAPPPIDADPHPHCHAERGRYHRAVDIHSAQPGANHRA